MSKDRDAPYAQNLIESVFMHQPQTSPKAQKQIAPMLPSRQHHRPTAMLRPHRPHGSQEGQFQTMSIHRSLRSPQSWRSTRR